MREGYRKRLSEGDIVYFVEGRGETGAGDLVVKKGSIYSAPPHINYPSVSVWDNVERRSSCNPTVALSPRSLFTAKEIKRLISQHEGPLGIDERPIDSLVSDPLANLELTAIVGGAAIQRLAEDELRNPRDPEY